MALEFRKRRFRIPGRKAQLALALLGLLLAMAILITWLVVSYRVDKAREDKKTEGENSSAVITEEYTEADDMYVLLMLSDHGHERFTLLKASPATPAMHVVSVPGVLTVGDGQILSAILQKNGAAAATKAVANSLELPIEQYIAMSGEETEKWLNYLEGGIAVTLPEAVEHIDDKGTMLRLDAGEHNVTATQAVALMRYNKWADADTNRTFHSEIVASMLSRYFHSGRRFSKDFAMLSNGCKTTLRISDYNAHADALASLAKHVEEDPSRLTLSTLQGDYTNGQFTLDLQTTKDKTNLYHTP